MGALTCADPLAPAPLLIHVVEPASPATVSVLDTVWLLGEATAEDIGLLPEDSVWWALGAVELSRGRGYRSRLPAGVHVASFHGRYGARHDSAQVTVVVVGSGVGAIRWVVPLPNQGDAVGLSQGLDGTLYALDGTQVLTAIGTDGGVRWRTDLPVFAPRLVPSIGPDGTLYLPYWDPGGGVLAISPSGTVLWDFNIRAQAPPGSAFYHVHGHAAVGADGTVYIASEEDSGAVYAVNPDGSLKWRTRTRTTETSRTRFTGPVTLVGDSLVVSLRRDVGRLRLFALSATDGAVRWNAPLGELGIETPGPAIGLNGTIYVVSSGNGYPAPPMSAVSPAGDSIWMRPDLLSVNRQGGPTVRGGRMFVPGVDGEVEVSSTTDGTSVTSWGPPLGVERAGSATIGRNGVVYVLGRQALVSYAADGQVRFVLPFPQTLLLGEAPIVGADGTVYVRVTGFGVVAVGDTVGPAADADWPTFQGNFQRQGRR